MDFAKAVCHSLLVHQLHHNGIQGKQMDKELASWPRALCNDRKWEITDCQRGVCGPPRIAAGTRPVPLLHQWSSSQASFIYPSLRWRRNSISCDREPGGYIPYYRKTSPHWQNGRRGKWSSILTRVPNWLWPIKGARSRQSTSCMDIS